MEEIKKIKNTLTKNKEAYGYKYVELAEINKYCLENDITYYQEVETNELNHEDYIVTFITRNGETTKHKGCKIVEARLNGINNPVQAYGSSLTYCRRYSLLLSLGLATDDDDAQELSMPAINSIEEAKAYRLTWGKYAGKTLGEIDESYLQWLIGNTKDENIKTACDFIINHTTKEDIDLLGLFEELLADTDTDREVLYEHYGVKSNKELTHEQLLDAISIMKKKESKK